MDKSNLKTQLKQFVIDLNNKEYYDAHETLEKIWFPNRFNDEVEVKFIKGLINASVSFELAKQGKLKASEKVWPNYLKYKDLINEIESKYKDSYKDIILLIDNIHKNIKE